MSSPDPFETVVDLDVVPVGDALFRRRGAGEPADPLVVLPGQPRPGLAGADPGGPGFR